MTCKECLDGALKAEEECSVCSGPAAEKARKIAEDVERLKQLFISGISYTTTTTSTLPGSWVQTGSSSSVTIPTGTTVTVTYTSDPTKD